MKENKDIRISEYNYTLDTEKIAKYPLSIRDESKLLRYKSGEIEESNFRDLPSLLPNNSMIIANDSKVVKARLIFRKETGARIEVFVLQPSNGVDFAISFAEKGSTEWVCYVGNARKWNDQTIYLNHNLENGETLNLNARIVSRDEDKFNIKFEWNLLELSWAEVLFICGNIPIPPYLDRKSEKSDEITYQTQYAEIDGSVAAPTAGLHFTPDLIKDVEAKGHSFRKITLHVGAGTFKPVGTDKVAEHEMHGENFIVRKEFIETLLNSKERPKVVIGTTSLRALESLYYIGLNLHQNISDPLHITQWQAYKKAPNLSLMDALNVILDEMKKRNQNELNALTQIMIIPGFKFRIADHLVTNFHQPKSTLLLLVAAFIGGDWRKVYDYALNNDFRFLSYGDSCFFTRIK